MSEYDLQVEKQRVLLEAEEWADGVRSIHIHSTKSMWYETEESSLDLDVGMVTDTEYNSGLIERKMNGNLIRTFGARKYGDDLLDSYLRGGK